MSNVPTTPSVGRIVLYRLSGTDCEAVNRRRRDAREHMDEHKQNATGVIIHVGTPVKEGDQLPMIVTSVLGTPENHVGGKVFLNGNDELFQLAVQHGEGHGEWHWPVMVPTQQAKAEVGGNPDGTMKAA